MLMNHILLVDEAGLSADAAVSFVSSARYNDLQAVTSGGLSGSRTVMIQQRLSP